MNTSLPRMFSLKRTETSPSSKRDTTASPTGTLRRLQIAAVSLWLAVPEKMRLGSTAVPPPKTDDARSRVCRAATTRAHDESATTRLHPVFSGHVTAGADRPAPASKMAGAGGFEPPYAGAKVSCLTAWPRPTNERGFRHGPPAVKRGGVKAAGPENRLWEKRRAA